MLNWFSLKEEGAIPKFIAIKRGQMIAVGRSPMCDVRINSKQVDSVHLLISNLAPAPHH